MADDRNKVGKPAGIAVWSVDRTIEQFAHRHGITPEDAQRLVAEHGPFGPRLMEAIAKARAANRYRDTR